MKTLFLFVLVALFMLLGGCSDQNYPVADPHGDDPLAGHAALAADSTESCKACHGEDYAGGSSGVSCLRCHPSGPPFRLHPPEWANTLADHGTFPDAYHWSLCATAACHGTALGGSEAGTRNAPSCFASTACHQVTLPVPHSRPFTAPASHGAQGRDREKYCFNCHGTLPNVFDGGFIASSAILSLPSGDCSGCHPAAEAHPTRWQGSNDITGGYSSSHRAVASAGIAMGCALCHSVAAAGAGPKTGAPSCFAASFTNADGSATGCHAGGPGGHPAGLTWLDRNAAAYHGSSTLVCTNCHNLATDCIRCHFGPSGNFSPTSWTHGVIGGHDNLETYGNVCDTCHGYERQLGYGPTSCVNCGH